MCPRPSKNTRSPAWRSSREAGTPTELYCIAALCGNEIPTCAYTYITKPEQSKPPGLAPPQTYGVPRYCIAIPTTPPYCDEGTGGASGADESTTGGVYWSACGCDASERVAASLARACAARIACRRASASCI